MPNDEHQSCEYHRQQGTRQLVDLVHLASPNQRFYAGRTLFRSIGFRPIGRRELGNEAARASILPATGSRTALWWLNVHPATRGVDLGGWLQFGRNRFFRFEQILIALGLSQKLLAFRARLIFFCRLKFADDDLVQLLDGPMRYGLPAHGPTKTLILVLDQSALVPYFYGCDQCFLRVRSFGITNGLVRSLFFKSPAADIAPGRKIFVARCKECLGKGRIDTPSSQ